MPVIGVCFDGLFGLCTLACVARVNAIQQIDTVILSKIHSLLFFFLLSLSLSLCRRTCGKTITPSTGTSDIPLGSKPGQGRMSQSITTRWSPGFYAAQQTRFLLPASTLTSSVSVAGASRVRVPKRSSTVPWSVITPWSSRK